MSITRYFMAYGIVQGVMFRQTLIRGSQKRGLAAGASNDPLQPDKVSFTLQGPIEAIDSIADFLKSGKPMNDWGARVEKLEELEKGFSIKSHQVNTENVDSFNWNPMVKMYL